MTPASIAGSYSITGFNYQKTQYQSLFATVAISANGTLAFSGTANTGGAVSAISGNGSYALFSDGTLNTLQPGESNWGLMGASGVAIVGEITPGVGPEFNILVKNEGSFTAASVAGTYTFADFSNTSSVDGSALATFTINANGTWSTGNVTGGYTLAADGSFSLRASSGTAVYAGHFSNTGVAIMAQVAAGNGPETVVLVKNEGSFSNASIAGSYAFVDFSRGTQDSSSIGTMTINANGTWTDISTLDLNGVITTGNQISGTYTLSADGSITLTSGDSLTGRVSPSGVIVLGANGYDNGSEIALLVRNGGPADAVTVNAVAGTAGIDAFMAGPAKQSIDGGAGVDTLLFPAARANFTVSRTGASYTVTDKTGVVGADTVSNVEILQFSDSSVRIDATGDGGTAGQAFRIYQAAFNRASDPSGLGYWTNALESGTSARNVAAGFMATAEFKSLYGANPTAAQFVTNLYSNVLHRAPDAAGFTYWTGLLNTGALATPDVLASFADSAENRAQVIGSIQNGLEFIPFHA